MAAGDVQMSLFLNELYGFQLDCHRWYPLELRKDKPSKDKSKGSKRLENADNSASDGMDYENDLKKPLVNVKNEISRNSKNEPDNVSSIHEVSRAMSQDLTFDDGLPDLSDGKVPGINGTSELQASATSEAVRPCGRINSCMVAGKDTLYLYGGMMEVKDQEITLDDLYSLNLSKLDEWKCVIPASASEWLEVSEEDEDEDEDDTEEEDSNSGTDSDKADDDAMEMDDVGETALDMENAVAILKGEKKNLHRKEKKARIEQIRATLGLSDLQRTPMPGESLRDFYKRTNMYWQMAAHEHTQHTGKELRKDGFDLAEARFRELKPILDELAILEAEQKAEEEEAGESSSRKRGDNNKKNKRQMTQR